MANKLWDDIFWTEIRQVTVAQKNKHQVNILQQQLLQLQQPKRKTVMQSFDISLIKGAAKRRARVPEYQIKISSTT